MHRSEFLKLVKERLPELRSALNRQEGQIHFEVEEPRKYAQRAIFDGNREALDICLRLAEEAYSEGDKELKNAIDVSFVEGLDFVTPHASHPSSHPWAWELMPTALKRLYEDFHGVRGQPQRLQRRDA
jgi:hypothetical protein